MEVGRPLHEDEIVHENLRLMAKIEPLGSDRIVIFAASWWW